MSEREHDAEQSASDAPTGGSETTEEQLEADNPVEQDMIDAVDPEGDPD